MNGSDLHDAGPVNPIAPADGNEILRDSAQKPRKERVWAWLARRETSLKGLMELTATVLATVGAILGAVCTAAGLCITYEQMNAAKNNLERDRQTIRLNEQNKAYTDFLTGIPANTMYLTTIAKQTLFLNCCKLLPSTDEQNLDGRNEKEIAQNIEVLKNQWVMNTQHYKSLCSRVQYELEAELPQSAKNTISLLEKSLDGLDDASNIPMTDAKGTTPAVDFTALSQSINSFGTLLDDFHTVLTKSSYENQYRGDLASLNKELALLRELSTATRPASDARATAIAERKDAVLMARHLINGYELLAKDYYELTAGELAKRRPSIS